MEPKGRVLADWLWRRAASSDVRLRVSWQNSRCWTTGVVNSRCKKPYLEQIVEAAVWQGRRSSDHGCLRESVRLAVAARSLARPVRVEYNALLWPRWRSWQRLGLGQRLRCEPKEVLLLLKELMLSQLLAL